MRFKTPLKEVFENAVVIGSAELLETLVQTLEEDLEPQTLALWNKIAASRQFSLPDFVRLLVTICQTTFVAPDLTTPAWDVLSEAWLEQQPQLLSSLSVFSRRPEIPTDVWQLFWEDMQSPNLGRIAGQVPHYLKVFGPNLLQSYATTLMRQEGLEKVAASQYVRPASLSLQSLAAYPPNTLGSAFYHQLADNGLELEIIKDRRNDVYEDARANYIGLRIYQTHDIWHVLLGYSVSGLDELALQAFQLAQTGSAGSAILLCLQIICTAFRNINSLPPLLNLIFRGWQHGRQTRPLLTVEWEELLNEPLTDLCERYQILTFSDFQSN